MAAFVKVAELGDLREDRGTLVRVGEIDLALFLRKGELFAITNVCAHQHFSVLHQGLLEGCTVTCPMHGWRYDLRTGKATTGDGRVAVHKIMLQGTDVLVEAPTE